MYLLRILITLFESTNQQIHLLINFGISGQVLIIVLFDFSNQLLPAIVVNLKDFSKI